MVYDIAISDNHHYLHISVDGDLTPDLLDRVIWKKAKKAAESEIDKYLFDLRLAANRTDVTTHYTYVYDRAKELGFKHVSRHALLVDPKNRKDYYFVETILINAGYESKLFTDEAAALAWLER